MTRPRGYIEWKPQKKTRVLVQAVQDVLEEYRDHLPMTVRQIFYRLVGKGVIDKSEKAYKQLCETVVMARRGGHIPMETIRDGQFQNGFDIDMGDYPSSFHNGVVWRAKHYRRDRQAGQTAQLVLWCEAAGMVPQLEAVAHPYSIVVKSSGGFDSVSAKCSIGAECAAHCVPVEVLHVGDYDPSGECMFDAFAEDVGAFHAEWQEAAPLTFTRVAVRPEHIAEFNLLTSPPKSSSHQERKQMTETVQAESLSPTELAEVVNRAILSRRDMNIYQQQLELEVKERDALIWMYDRQ